MFFIYLPISKKARKIFSLVLGVYTHTNNVIEKSTSQFAKVCNVVEIQIR